VKKVVFGLSITVLLIVGCIALGSCVSSSNGAPMPTFKLASETAYVFDSSVAEEDQCILYIQSGHMRVRSIDFNEVDYFDRMANFAATKTIAAKIPAGEHFIAYTAYPGEGYQQTRYENFIHVSVEKGKQYILWIQFNFPNAVARFDEIGIDGNIIPRAETPTQQ
jgi:hypothetical protein